MAKKVSKTMHAKSNSKYARELERIKALNDLGKIIKRGDIESALQSEIERDSESARQSNIDNLINQLAESDKGSVYENRLELIERLTTGTAAVKISKSVHKVNKPPKKSAQHKQSKKHMQIKKAKK